MSKVIVILFIFCALYAQKKTEYVLKPSERIITTQKRWGNKFIWVVEGDLIIRKGAKLIIDPGTTVLFKPRVDVSASGKDPELSEIIVRGQLIAIGRPFQGQKITFTSYDANNKSRSGDWYGLSIYRNSGQQRTKIQYCDIYYAYNGISSFGSDPQIKNNQIMYSYNTGIHISVKSNAEIGSNLIKNNFYAGIEISKRSSPKIYDNFIQENEYGIMIYDSSTPNIGLSTKSKKTKNGNNVITDNFEYDIYNHSFSDIRAENNTWSSTDPAEVMKTIYASHLGNNNYGKVSIHPMANSTIAETQRTFQLNDLALANTVKAVVNKPKQSKSNPVRNRSTTTRRPTTTKRASTKRNTPVKKDPVVAKTNNTSLRNNKTQNTNNQSTTNTAIADKPVETLTNNSANIAATEAKPAEVKEEIVENKAPVEDYTLISRSQPYITNILDPGTGLELYKQAATYEGLARDQNIKGKVIIQFIIGFDGKVEEANILRTDHIALNELARKAALKFRFSVGKVQGQPVRFKLIRNLNSKCVSFFQRFFFCDFLILGRRILVHPANHVLPQSDSLETGKQFL